MLRCQLSTPLTGAVSQACKFVTDCFQIRNDLLQRKAHCLSILNIGNLYQGPPDA